MTNVNESVNVFCRLKPLDDKNVDSCIKYENHYTIRAIPPAYSKRNNKEMIYNFTKIFDYNSSQSEIFNDVAYPLVNDLLNGKNGLLFTYGVTGSGKTFTMKGISENPGIVVRTVQSLFKRVSFIKRFRIRPDDRNRFKIYSENDAIPLIGNKRNDYSRRSGNYECKRMMGNVIDDPFEKVVSKNCTIFISMVEIYGNTICDLLAKKGTENSPDVKMIRDCNKNFYFHNARQEEVQTAEEALYFYLKGQERRRTGATKLNMNSSRSHCVFNIRLVKVEGDVGSEYDDTARDGNCRVLVTQLSLIDLAGSERAKRTDAVGMQLREAGFINNSLMELRILMQELRKRGHGDRTAIDSSGTNPLNKLVKSSFNTGSKIHMVVCVQQKPSEYDETLNVLEFAEDVKEVLIVTSDCKSVVQTLSKTTKISKEMAFQTPPDHRSDAVEIDGDWSAEDEARAIAIGREIDARQKRVEGYRMVLQKELDDPFEMARTILNLFEELDQIEKNRSELEELFEDCELDNSDDKIDELDRQLRDSRNEISRLKTASTTAKTEAEVRERQLNEKIRKLEQKNEQLLLKNLNDNCMKNRDSIVSNPKKSVKVLAQKFEQTISTNKSRPVLGMNRNVIKNRGSILKRGFVNSRFRKSKTPEVFFEQKEKNEIPAGMLNRVKLKNRRSSKKIELGELKKCDRYVLQNQTVTGEQFQTDYHKGDIVPTAAGGIAVQFTDCETVIHHSPFQSTHATPSQYSRKRQSSTQHSEAVSSDDDNCSKRYRGCDV